MAKKAAKSVDVVDDPILVTTHDPKTTIGLDTSQTGTYDYVPAPDGWLKDRRLLLQGRSYEHVADDADGCWLYRASAS